MKKYKTSWTGFLGLLASTVSMLKNLAQDIFTDDLFEIIRQMLGKKIC